MELEKTIQRKEKKLKKIQDDILAMNDSIKKVSTDLQTKKREENSSRVAGSRLSTHTKSILGDITKRPPDRSYDIRTYSKMDVDLWLNPDVSRWFNKDAPQNMPTYNFSPIESGYTIAN